MDVASFKPITIRGAELRYRRQGQGEPLVLVHANISDVRSLAVIAEKLAPHFEVITYCRRFHWPNTPLGDSQPDPWEEQALDLAFLIDALELGPVYVLGNSSGGTLAMMLARDRSELVKGLILEEPVAITVLMPHVPPTISDLVYLLWTCPWAFIPTVLFGANVMARCEANFQRGDDEAGLRTFARGVIGEKHTSTMSLERWDQMRANLKPHAAIFTGVGLPKFSEQEARNIRVPTLFLTGEATVSTHRWMDYYISRMIPGAKQVTVEGAGHLVHESNPDSVVKEIVQYFKNESQTWSRGR
jgi:pimeloyl-ACP methyl ester carboxylesterase